MFRLYSKQLNNTAYSAKCQEISPNFENIFNLPCKRCDFLRFPQDLACFIKLKISVSINIVQYPL